MVTKRLILSRTLTIGNWKYREDILPNGTKLLYFNGAVSIKCKTILEKLDDIVKEEDSKNIVPEFLRPFIKGGY